MQVKTVSKDVNDATIVVNVLIVTADDDELLINDVHAVIVITAIVVTVIEYILRWILAKLAITIIVYITKVKK